MSDEQDSSDELNLPNMDKIAYQVAIEHLASMYKEFRRAGLPARDAATIIAQMLYNNTSEEES